MFLTPTLVQRLRQSLQTNPALAEIRQSTLDAAKPWLAMSDDELWSLMFGPTITRSWDVWSNGYCPTCRKPVPLYNWIIKPLENPWKTTCPECKDVFPKNDFIAFYRSGLDEANIFQYRRADRKLLFNVEHPDPSDPLHHYGVDDGEGYLTPGNTSNTHERWRFVGAWLIYGQWKGLVLAGITNLANAFAVGGDPAAARKAAILLDRVADLYPTFDFKTQAWVEEVYRTSGYVSTWHDACMETRGMAQAYVVLRDAIDADTQLHRFLADKAKRHGIENPKATGGDIRRNIETRILADAIEHPDKIHCNYPHRHITEMVLHGAIAWPGRRARVMELASEVARRASACDGVTGEKGLNGYAAWTIEGLAWLLGHLERIEPGSLAQMLREIPSLRQSFRFHIDTWCLQNYYPQVGDANTFARPEPKYLGVRLDPAKLDVSGYTFLDALYQATGDHAYIQAMLSGCDYDPAKIPVDPLQPDPAGFRERVARVVKEHGTEIQLGNTLKPDWHLAILRSGRGADRRAIWMEYDAGGSHGHYDALNIGIFAKGFDLMPDYGYPPLQFSRWEGPHCNWYRATAAHASIVIDGKNQRGTDYSLETISGRHELWGDGKSVAVVRVAAPAILARNLLTSVATLAGPDHERVGLYTWAGMEVRNLRVYTKPEGASAGDDGWTLAFSDDFNRTQLGGDWRVDEGEWKLSGGALVGKGMLTIMRKFPGSQRVEFDAVTRAENPCDLSAFLCADERGHMKSAFFGLGSNDNTHSKLVLSSREASSVDYRIGSNVNYRIRCERDGDTLRHMVNGDEIQRVVNSQRAIDEAVENCRRTRQLDRTLVRIDVSDADSYFVDITRAVVGRDHAKFLHSSFSTLSTHGLETAPAPDYANETLMRNFRTDAHAKPGWHADWAIINRHKIPNVPEGVRLRYTDVSGDVEVSTCEGWISAGFYNTTDEAWIPRIMIRRRTQTAPLASAFAGVLEPYIGRPRVTAVRRLRLEAIGGRACGDGNVALETTLDDGRRDLIVAIDNPQGPRAGEAPSLTTGPENQRGWEQPDWRLRSDAQIVVARRDAGGAIIGLSLAHGSRAVVGDVSIQLDQPVEFIEIEFPRGTNRATAKVVAASQRAGLRATIGNKPAELHWA